ncbi:VOC family protein [Paracoccus spongiarum]|uniref:VOC family protein n=1 Tax=Paracoccus spongiarum TaxID=3064387 RepID=A0ABT9JGF4_9RHOB|nr:VOC family protein [Paracoccus sp. 2205BS29-5]MDP5308854.1 VOC family protein [Paracoccus sp. 2205BS29-5]
MTAIHGRPLWYELACAPGRRAEAEAFYAGLFGWTVAPSGMEGFDYDLARCQGAMVAGIMDMPADVAGMPPLWLIYFGVADLDVAVAAATAQGAAIHRPPFEVANTGRIAILGDPQGAGFGLLEPGPMQDGTGGNAFDRTRAGHGNWNELMTADPAAALDFYGRLLGWQQSTEIPMGEMGTYQLFAHEGADIGGMQGLGNAPAPAWLPYFGFNGLSDAVARIADLGGAVLHGPQEVPGGAHIAIARDPQGAQFAIVGPLDHAG